MKSVSKALVLSWVLGASTSAFAGTVSPSSVLIKLYAILASTSTSCANPVVVVNYGTDGKTFDFMKTPDLGGGKLPDGTYPCVILKMSDVITIVPAGTTGLCTAGQSYTLDVCRSGGGGGTYTPVTISGTTATYGTVGTACTGTYASPSDNQPGLFLTTTGTTVSGGGSGQSFDSPAGDVRNGFKLNGALVVSGSGGGQFVVDFTNKINGASGSGGCDLDPPTFSFR